MSLSSANRAVPIAALALTLTSLTLDGQPIDDGQIAEHFRAGQQDMQHGRFAEAVTQFKEALRGQPGLVEARVNLGLAYQALGDYTLAVAELSRAVRQRPNLLPASLFLGISYLKLGLPEKAIPPLHIALSIDPSSREAARALATAEMEQLNYREAAARFRKLSSSDPDKASGWYGLGHDYLEMVTLSEESRSMRANLPKVSLISKRLCTMTPRSSRLARCWAWLI